MKGLQIRTLFIVVIASVLLFSACSKSDSQSMAGSGKAPDFTLDVAGGGSVSLSDELAGKKAVLVFFATWCPYCVKEVPHVNAFYSGNKDKASVIGINIQESEAKVQSFIKKKGIIYPVALDSDGKVAGLYGIRGIPAVLAIDKNRDILFRGSSIEEMKKKVQF